MVFTLEIDVQFRIACLALFATIFTYCPLLFGQENDLSRDNSESSTKPSDRNGLKEKSSSSSNANELVKTGKSISRSYEFKKAKKELAYQMYVPRNYYDAIQSDADKKFPLIVALHGYGSNPQQIVGYPGFVRRAEKRGYIVVAPMGYNKKGWYGSHGQKGGYGDVPRNLGELSEQDVLNVLEITQKEFNIDPRRIYIYGHSMGGGGSIHLAMKYPDKWAAVAPMAPAMPWGLRNLEQAKSIPFFVVHGDNDKVLAVKKTRGFVEQMKELKMTHVYREVKGGDHVTVAWKYFDEIFDFFDEHVKPSSSSDKTAK